MSCIFKESQIQATTAGRLNGWSRHWTQATYKQVLQKTGTSDSFVNRIGEAKGMFIAAKRASMINEMQCDWWLGLLLGFKKIQNHCEFLACCHLPSGYLLAN